MRIIDVDLEFNSNMSRMGNIDGIVLHHTGVATEQSVEIIHNYHKNHNGWAGIGYHYYVRKDGSIYKGRPEEYAGAHCPGVNSSSIGICAEGNFEIEEMSDIQKNSIIELIAYLKSNHNIEYIKGHREILATSCPGDNYPFEEIVNGVHICGDVEKVLNEQLTSISTEAELQELLNEVYGAELDVDGIVGPKTNAALRKVALRNYCENDLVGFIQRRLIMNGHGVGETGVDCKYGRLTENAVIKFQQEHGLVVDGIAGINTIKELL
jgi:N-acetylmuramoyl-L-alanine amidase